MWIYGFNNRFERCLVVSIQLLILAQGMISRFLGSGAASGSVLTGWSLLGIHILSLSLPLPCSLCLSNIKFYLKKQF